MAQTSQSPFLDIATEALRAGFDGDGHTLLRASSPHILCPDGLLGIAQFDFDDSEQLLAAFRDRRMATLVLPSWERFEPMSRPARKETKGEEPGGPPWAVMVPAHRTRALARISAGAYMVGTPSIILEGPLRARNVDSRFVALLLVYNPRRESELTRFFRIPEEDTPTDELRKDFTRLLRQRGGSTRWGFVRASDEVAIDSLRYVDNDPAVDHKIKDLALFGQGRQVGDRFEVLSSQSGRKTSVPLREDDSGRVLTGRDLLRTGELREASEQDPRPRATLLGRSPVVLQEGDLLLRALESSGFPTRPHVVESRDLPATAGVHVIVLRPRTPLSAAEAAFYVNYLGSARFREVARAPQKGATFSLVGLRGYPLPEPDAALLEALRQLQEAKREFEAYALQVDQVLSDAFDEDSVADARNLVIQEGRASRLRAETAARIGTLDHRLANFYPYPIAHRWRRIGAALSASDLRDAYTATLDCFETLLAYCAAIALAFSHRTGIPVGALEEVRNKLTRENSGPGVGDWVNVLKQVASAKAFRAVPDSTPLASIRGFLPEGSAAAKAQERLSQRRNDQSHQRRVDDRQLLEALQQAQDDLRILLSNADFLSDTPLLHIKSNQWDSLRQTGTCIAQALRGDNPVPDSHQVVHTNRDLENESLYLQDITGELVLLRPFLVRLQCPACGNYSIFHPDRRVKDQLQLKAIDHSHTTSVHPQHEEALRIVRYLRGEQEPTTRV